ncbi:MAG TPA: medium chain dehydrogenase/reductase family protein [Thermoleophilaceae bacterium]|nr:medium chain dehydrogenase/reductase family protein [Thermoleophilaceae bacterium]
MRALVLTRHGGPEVLEVHKQPDPEPRLGQVRIAVRAIGVNFAELMARVGLYPDAPKPPCVLGYEVAGEVEAIGDSVDGVAVGDRVVAGTRFGGYAERVVAAAEELVPLPEGWSFEEGAALPVNYATAYAGLVRYGALRQGERVLLHAAAGGVGIAATQIATHLGAEVFGTASASKHEAIRGYGVRHPIDYRSEDFVRAVRRATGERQPLDLVMDAVGGSSYRRSFSLLRAGGRLVCFGASSAVSGDRRDLVATARSLLGTPWFNALRLSSASKAVIGLNVLTLWDSKGTLDELVRPLTELVEAGAIRPVVAEAFPLERGGEAHRFMQERRNVGKVVLTV